MATISLKNRPVGSQLLRKKCVTKVLDDGTEQMLRQTLNHEKNALQAQKNAGVSGPALAATTATIAGLSSLLDATKVENELDLEAPPAVVSRSLRPAVGSARTSSSSLKPTVGSSRQKQTLRNIPNSPPVLAEIIASANQRDAGPIQKLTARLAVEAEEAAREAERAAEIGDVVGAAKSAQRSARLAQMAVEEDAKEGLSEAQLAQAIQAGLETGARRFQEATQSLAARNAATASSIGAMAASLRSPTLSLPLSVPRVSTKVQAKSLPVRSKPSLTSSANAYPLIPPLATSVPVALGAASQRINVPDVFVEQPNIFLPRNVASLTSIGRNAGISSVEEQEDLLLAENSGNVAEDYLLSNPTNLEDAEILADEYDLQAKANAEAAAARSKRRKTAALIGGIAAAALAADVVAKRHNRRKRSTIKK